MLSKVLFTVLGIACFLAAAFGLLLAYVSFTSPEIGAGFGSFLLAITAVLSVIGFFVLKKTVASKQAPSSAPVIIMDGPAVIPEPVEEEPSEEPVPVEADSFAIPEPENEDPETVPEPGKEEPAAADPVVSIPDDSKNTVFLVAGIYYREDAIIDNLLYENPDFDMK